MPYKAYVFYSCDTHLIVFWKFIIRLRIDLWIRQYQLTWATRRVPHVEHYLPALLEHLRPTIVLRLGSCYLVICFVSSVLCILFVCLSLFFFRHGVLSLFSIYLFEWYFMLKKEVLTTATSERKSQPAMASTLWF